MSTSLHPTDRLACRGCGGPVSHDFIRVLGVDGEVHACPACGDTSMLAQQAGGLE